MLKLLAVRPEWTAQDSAELRQFLAGPFGQKFFNSLLFTRPEVLGVDPEVRRIRSDERGSLFRVSSTASAQSAARGR